MYATYKMQCTKCYWEFILYFEINRHKSKRQDKVRIGLQLQIWIIFKYFEKLKILK